MKKREKAKFEEINDKLEVFYKCCRENKLKITPQRIEIYKALLESDEHPSAEMVYEKTRQTMPNVSFDTVNRTLNTLSQIGAAFVVEGSGEVRRFDGNLDSHQHFKCINCRKIFDFHYDNIDNVKIPENLGDGFKILRTTVYVEGLCQACQKNENKNK